MKTYRLLLTLSVMTILSGCGSAADESVVTAAPSPINQSPQSPTITIEPLITNTSAPNIQEPEISTPSPAPVGPQILANSGFDTGVKDWDRPYGTLSHTKSRYHTGPGAARLTTSDSSGFMDYLGNMGQCVDLSDYLDEWPLIDGDRYMTLEAYLLPGEDLSRVTLNGIFIDDKNCGTGHVGSFDIPALAGSDDWILLSGMTTVPETAQSFHVFISASGRTDQASVLIDDIRAYASDPKIH